MDRPRVERSVERPADRAGDVGRQERMPSHWSSGSPANQHRYVRGGVGDLGDEGFSGGRYHPYRGQPDHPLTGNGVGGGPVFRGGQGLRGGPGSFGSHQMPMGGNKRGFDDYGEGNKFTKLFIGSVPRTATEEDIRPLFEEHGDVIEVALIRDRRTGQQQGCCFIKYATLEHAERAIRALHNNCTLPGGTGPIQVRYADGERERLVEEKLFVASLNKRATEKEVEDIFAPYGHVEDVYLMKDEMKESRGCGFVKFSSRDMALAAMNALHGCYVMRGCNQPLIVRFADRKRPRPMDQRGAPAFGGPGFGPRSDAVIPNRQMNSFDELEGGHKPHNGWDSATPLQSTHGFGNHTTIKGGITPTMASGSGSFGEGVAPANGTLPNPALISSTSQQSFTPSVAQVFPAVGQQMLPLQKSLMVSQSLPPSFPSHNTLLSSSNTLTQSLQAPFQQHGQLQLPHSIGFNSLNQGLLEQQFPGLGRQVSASSSLIMHNATAAATQNPLSIQQQGLATAPSQQQLLASNIPQQLVQQSMQQLPSQILLQQQAQTLQSSFQSSQQAIFQIQQQLQMMQQSNLNQQQNPVVAKQQTPWTGQTQWAGPPPTSSASANTPAVPANTAATAIPTTISATPLSSSAPAGIVTLSCNWTEHTSPEGFKYYYNSATRESKWEKPEDLTLFEHQQQQHKLFILQQQQVLQQQQQQQLLQQQHQQLKIAPQQQQSPSHTPSQALAQNIQQASQSQVQPQMQLMQQVQLQILQPSLAHSAPSAAGHQTGQDLSYAELHGANSVTDSARAQPGIQVAQGWTWKNKTGGT